MDAPSLTFCASGCCNRYEIVKIGVGKNNMNEMSILREKLTYLRDREDFSKANMTFSVANDNTHLLWTSSHRYQLGACLPEPAIKAIEQKYHLTLPDDYRRF